MLVSNYNLLKTSIAARCINYPLYFYVFLRKVIYVCASSWTLTNNNNVAHCNLYYLRRKKLPLMMTHPSYLQRDGRDPARPRLVGERDQASDDPGRTRANRERVVLRVDRGQLKAHRGGSSPPLLRRLHLRSRRGGSQAVVGRGRVADPPGDERPLTRLILRGRGLDDLGRNARR